MFKEWVSEYPVGSNITISYRDSVGVFRIIGYEWVNNVVFMTIGSHTVPLDGSSPGKYFYKRG